MKNQSKNKSVRVATAVLSLAAGFIFSASSARADDMMEMPPPKDSSMQNMPADQTDVDHDHDHDQMKEEHAQMKKDHKKMNKTDSDKKAMSKNNRMNQMGKKKPMKMAPKDPGMMDDSMGSDPAKPEPMGDM